MNIEREPNMTRTAAIALVVLMVLTGNAGRGPGRDMAITGVTVTA